MGAVVFCDFWLVPRLGLRPFFAEAIGTSFHWAPGLTWFITLGVCTFLVTVSGVPIYFVSLPGWFVAAILYLMLSTWIQKNTRWAETMRGSS
jgi:hypothetical protein